MVYSSVELLFQGTVKAAIADVQFEDELEDIVKPSENELAMRQQVAKKRKPVQILLPSLSQMDSDSDDEIDIKQDSKKVKTVPASGKCGLFSILPPPVVGAKLLPHKLSKAISSEQPQKKLPAVSSVQAVQKKVPVVSSVILPQKNLSVVSSANTPSAASTSVDTAVLEDDNDEDDFESSLNFFALDSGSQIKSSLPVKINFPHKTLHVTDAEVLDSSTDIYGPSVLPSENYQYQANDYDVHNALVDGMQRPDTSLNNAYQYNMQAEHSRTNHTYMQPVDDEDVDDEDVDDDVPESSSFDKCLQDEQFLRLCGRKHKQAVNIIDVHADDQLRDVDLTKNISQETQNLMSHSKKRNKDMPSSQQKRKHQITYLAFKAKERELELKNQWAENKFNKRQTQSKYGF